MSPDLSPRDDFRMSPDDVETAIARALRWGGTARAILLSDAAIASAGALDDLDIGVFPVEFLAYCVRSMGLERAAELAEPLPGPKAAELARGWLVAAAQVGPGGRARGGAASGAGETGSGTARGTGDGAGGAAPGGMANADVVAAWLCRVAKLIAARRSVRSPVEKEGAEPPDSAIP
jgi:hypothetical protein